MATRNNNNVDQRKQNSTANTPKIRLAILGLLKIQSKQKARLTFRQHKKNLPSF
jgi:hypothetical protein